MTVRNRTDLKSFFVKNAIPTEGNFADLIDSGLNQAQDGVFKTGDEPLSIVAAAGAQKRVMRLYSAYPAPNPDWTISLGSGLGISDGAGNMRLELTGAGGSGSDAGRLTVWGPLAVTGTLNAKGVTFEGPGVEHVELNGALYRHTDGRTYLTVDQLFHVRDRGSTGWAARFNTNAGSLELKGSLNAVSLNATDGVLSPKGVIANGLNMGRNGAVTTYQFPYETIGTDVINHNLRVCSRRSIILHAASDVVVSKAPNGDVTGNGMLRVEGQLIVSGPKKFQIDHPLEPERRHLVHSCIEGPEAAVLYRGEAALRDGACEVALPPYFEALAREENRTVQLTPRLEEGSETSALAAGAVADGRFTVRAIDGRNPRQRFYWEVKAVRADVEPIAVEPLKSPA